MENVARQDGQLLRRITELNLISLEPRIAPSPLLVMPDQAQSDLDSIKSKAPTSDQAKDHIPF